LVTKESHSQARPAGPQAAYLIRCWSEAETWRYSIEDVASRQRRRYDSIEALLEAIEVQILDFELASRAG
jgi:hypothetical protein